MPCGVSDRPQQDHRPVATDQTKPADVLTFQYVNDAIDVVGWHRMPATADHRAPVARPRPGRIESAHRLERPIEETSRPSPDKAYIVSSGPGHESGHAAVEHRRRCPSLAE